MDAECNERPAPSTASKAEDKKKTLQASTKTSFKYLGATLTKDGTCKTEIHIQIAVVTAAMARLTRVWKCNISFQTKFKLYKSLVISILLYGCETGHFLLRQKEGYRHLRINAWESSFISPTGSIRPMNMNLCGTKSKVLWDNRNLSSPLLSGRSSHGLAMSHNMTAYAKLSCKALLKADAGRDDNIRLGQTTSKCGWTCQCHNSWQLPLIVHSEIDCLLMLLLLSDPPMTRSVKGMIWHDKNQKIWSLPQQKPWQGMLFLGHWLVELFTSDTTRHR